MEKGKLSRSVSLIISGAALLMVLLWFYWPVLVRLGKDLGNEDNSYALLLPLVSLYVGYLKWPKLSAEPLRPSGYGLIFLALSLGLYAIGELAAELYTTRLSFVAAVASLVFLTGGWRLFRLLAFPLLLLVMMLPLPQLITYKLTLPLQLSSSQLATFFLQALGVAVFRQGNIIDLGVRQLQVVAVCSGLRYILALFAMGVIYCYFYERRLWKAAILMVALIPAAIIGNALRIAAIGLIPLFEAGFWHEFSGWLIFLFCLGFTFMLSYGLNLIWPSVPTAAGGEKPLRNPAAKPGRRSLLVPLFLAGIGIIALANPLVARVDKPDRIAPLQSFDQFPMTLGAWSGHQTSVDPVELEETGASAHLSAEFINPGHSPVSLWIAYYETQKKAGGFVHSPKGCLTAAGWQTKESNVVQIPGGLRVNYMLVDQMGTSILVYYWFLQRGRWLTSEYLNKFYMAYDGIVRHRTDGALIRLVTPAGRDLEAAQNRLNRFTVLLTPELHQFIPD
jgi:exosortase D (VPLPA-CTERM-specific)